MNLSPSPLNEEWWKVIEHRSRGIKFGRAFAVATLAAGAALFFVYWLLAYSATSLGELPSSNIHHLLYNVFANIVCIAIVYNQRGHVDQRLRAGLLAVLLVHGGLILIILALRLYYSRTVLSLGVLSSVGLVTATALASHNWFPLRIGIVPGEFQPEVWKWLPAGATVIHPGEVNVSGYDLILVDWSTVTDPSLNDFLARAMLSGCEVQHVARFVEERSGRVSLDHFAPEHATRTLNGFYLAYIKQPLDVVLVTLILPAAMPFLLAGMLAVLVTMGRPILFTQPRVGWGGRLFRVIKLRTMTATDTGVATSIDDTRITPVGRFLRRYRIDEIPQLFNVLLGDMSLIGPRPEQPALVERYSREIPSFNYRLLLLPGITGWAQIRSRYAANDEETRAKLTYDLYYLKNTSLLMDLGIVFDTVRAILLGTSSR